MEYAMGQIAQDYLRDKRMVRTMKTELQELPCGHLTHRTIHGRHYCYIQFFDPNGVRRNKLVLKAETERVEQIFYRRDFLKRNIKILQSHIGLLEKTYPQLRTLSDATLQSKVSENVGKPYLTAKGDYVRSKSEVIIANELYNHGISYEYEKPLLLDGYAKPILPDFTIYTSGGQNVIWEHCGLMNDPEYRSKWEWKRKLYDNAGISEWRNNLFITYESGNGDFSVEDVQQYIARLLRM